MIQAMGCPDWAKDFGNTPQSRAEHGEALNTLLSIWFQEHSVFHEVAALLGQPMFPSAESEHRVRSWHQISSIHASSSEQWWKAAPDYRFIFSAQPYIWLGPKVVRGAQVQIPDYGFAPSF